MISSANADAKRLGCAKAAFQMDTQRQAQGVKAWTEIRAGGRDSEFAKGQETILARPRLIRHGRI